MRQECDIYKITGELNEPGKAMTILIDAIDAVNELKTMLCGEFDNCLTTKSIKVIKK